MPFKPQQCNVKEAHNQICFMINQLNEKIQNYPDQYASFIELINELAKSTFSGAASSSKLFSKLHISLPSFLSPNTDNSSNGNLYLSANSSNSIGPEQLILPPVEDTIKIMFLFNELFESITPELETNYVWTFIFSQYNDQSIFPLFYSYIYIFSRRTANTQKLPMEKICLEVGLRLKKYDEKQELKMASQRIDELINLLENDDGIKNREIVRNQIETIIKIARGNAIIEELLPIKFISEYLDKIFK